MKVEITALAEADLDAIYRHIREDSPTRAAAWRQGLLLAAQALEQFPQRCSLAPESGAALDIRQLLYGRYRILFTLAGDTVFILHLRHSARQPLTEELIDESDAT